MTSRDPLRPANDATSALPEQQPSAAASPSPFSVCPGVPERCEHSQATIARAMEGVVSADRLAGIRQELGHCDPCLGAFDFEVGFKAAVAQRATDQAPASLQVRISQTLQRIDLDQIDVTDL